MREILFRGQTRRYGEKVRMGDGAKVPSHWVYGGVLQGVSSHSIIYGGENVNDPSEGLDKWVVHTDTLGQFTGLTDKNGKKIFEGDILKDVDGAMDGIPRIVYWSGYDMAFNCPLVKKHWAYGTNDIPLKMMRYHNIEVIGNIHDNPELVQMPLEDE